MSARHRRSLGGAALVTTQRLSDGPAGLGVRGSSMTLSGQTALVTGASRGLGRAIALRLARGGAAVGVNYREQVDAAEAVVREIRAHGGRALAVRADVANGAQIDDMVARVTSALGTVDILVNNAGVSRRGGLEDFDVAEVENMRRINIDGVVAVTRAVVGTG
jgi:3-oxoacyl-[acyl-carrier protein] reductase